MEVLSVLRAKIQMVPSVTEVGPFISTTYPTTPRPIPCRTSIKMNQTTFNH